MLVVLRRINVGVVYANSDLIRCLLNSDTEAALTSERYIVLNYYN